MTIGLVHGDPQGMALLLERDGLYSEALARLHGERFLAYRRSWKERGLMGDPGHFPLSLDLRLNPGCQLACVMCPMQGRKALAKGPGMPLPLLRRLLSEGREHGLPAVTLGLASEPLLAKGLFDALGLCGRAGVMDIRLGTNGLGLSKAKSERLLDSPLTRLEVSVDATNASTYRAIRGGDYDSLIRKIEGFLGLRAKKGQSFPLLRLSFLRLPQNEGELPGFLSLWKDRADMLSIQRPVWFPDSRLPKPDGLGEADSSTPCGQPWQRLGVLEDGSLWPCCSWYGEGMLALDAKKSGISELWRGEEMEGLRKSLKDGNAPAPCAACQAAGAH